MTNRITDETIMNALNEGGVNMLSVCMFALHCIKGDFQENKDFLESRGCDTDVLYKILAEYVYKEKVEFAMVSAFQPQMGDATPEFHSIIKEITSKAHKEQRELFFEDFINAIFNNKKRREESYIAFALSKAGYKHNPNAKTKKKVKYKQLSELCDDLNEKASKKLIDPLIGRRDEVQRMVEILSHYKKKNPLLVGPPGVGKTQVVEGLASLIEQDQVPEAIKGSRIFSLEVSRLLGGTKFRGDFEQRLTELMKELKQAKEDGENYILFVDEIHTAMGAGAGGQGQGGTDMSNILKPALASGDISLIGSTTDAEFKKHISKDKAFSRRLQQVKIEEPSATETLRILEQGIKPVLEKFHNVKYSKKVLKRAVELSGKYMTQQYFPDKAISVIDSVGARIKTNDKSKRTNATVSDVEQIISRDTGTPVSAMKEKTTKQTYVDLETIIKGELFGQDSAVDKVVESYELAKAGLSDDNQPIASWLLLGPTGVGKTELAKLIAKHTESNFFKINMGEYGEKHSPAKLFGAPPGYEGHRDGGVLTNEITKYPHTVLLLDEIEKAHEKVYESLLGIIDGGTMTDGEGNVVDFSNTLILMTSNAGAALAQKTKAPLGLMSTTEDQQEAQVQVKMDVINDTFSPEFRNKLSGMVHFSPLSKEVISKITDKFILESVNKMFLKKNFKLEVDSEVKEFLCEEGYDPLMGARPISRIVKEYIDKPLVKPILRGEINQKDTVKFTMKDGKPTFSVVTHKEESKELMTESK